MIRKCQKHQKPFPCGPCRIENAAKPAQVGSLLQKPNVEQFARASRMLRPVNQQTKIDMAFAVRFVWKLENIGRKTIADVVREEWRNSVAASGILAEKCLHGIYLPEEYCNYCSLKTVAGEDYDVDKYRAEISKAVAHAKTALRYGATWVTPRIGPDGLSNRWNKPEGQRRFEDLLQLVDIEIWKATKVYRDELNGALAYTIAKNTSQKFLGKHIEENTILVTDADGNPVLDIFGQEQGLNGAELKRKSEDLALSKKERKEAQDSLTRYAVRVPKFISLDDMKFFEKDVTGQEFRGVSPAELEIHEKQKDSPEKDWLDVMRDQGGIPVLAELVKTWHGDKRIVGEAMLQPDFNVRSVPGVQKDRVARIRQGILKDFRTFLAQNGS